MKIFSGIQRYEFIWKNCILLFLCICACQKRGEKMTAALLPTTGFIDSIPKAGWDALSKKRIFFGHQSVGANILDGINDLMAQSSRIQLSIQRTRDPKDFERPIFAESAIGMNDHPQSKIDDFRKVMEGGVGAKVDIAFFKLCFVDINTKTDVQSLFTYYKKTMDGLQSEFPKVRFIHCTAPLTTMDTGIKLAIKKLLGKDGGASVNLRRAMYNRMITDAYGREGNVLDIARYESTFPNNERMVRKIGGLDCYGLVPGYTSDGGHLNQIGRITVAAELLKLLQSML